jgi:hypothetical protein
VGDRGEDLLVPVTLLGKVNTDGSSDLRVTVVILHFDVDAAMGRCVNVLHLLLGRLLLLLPHPLHLRGHLLLLSRIHSRRNLVLKEHLLLLLLLGKLVHRVTCGHLPLTLVEVRLAAGLVV